ncbi:MAG: ADP-glyceromanno-heptose 6-epimerase [Desulfarculaceae bacterium]|jgi:ADP-L-glycero-D-manno-heptose 6-epimerase
MIVVTGGAGFIGSRLVHALNQKGSDDILVVDHLGKSEKWRNLNGLIFADYLDRSQFIQELEAGHFGAQIEAIFHLGACSSTIETNTGYLMENNYRYTCRLAAWRAEHPRCRLIYASSAATYGNGAQGYEDDQSAIERLRPLNAYGFSKHRFDLVAMRKGWLRDIAGLKYFNVFGPNEGHKGAMRSLIHKSFAGLRQEGVLRLFKSYRPDFADGEQVRDFIYVDDAVNITLFFLDNPSVNGIFNVGTGVGRTWNDLARAMFRALDMPVDIQYIDMPAHLRGKYQYFTQAEMTKLRQAGCEHQCLSLEDAVEKYLTEYLLVEEEA